LAAASPKPDEAPVIKTILLLILFKKDCKNINADLNLPYELYN
jgi:hypothetical protein